MHPGLRLEEQRLELKPAELISWKQRWQEPDYGVSLQPAQPRSCPPLPSRPKVNAVFLFVPLPTRAPSHAHNMNTPPVPTNMELLDPVTSSSHWKSHPRVIVEEDINFHPDWSQPVTQPGHWTSAQSQNKMLIFLQTTDVLECVHFVLIISTSLQNFHVRSWGGGIPTATPGGCYARDHYSKQRFNFCTHETTG